MLKNSPRWMQQPLEGETFKLKTKYIRQSMTSPQQGSVNNSGQFGTVQDKQNQISKPMLSRNHSKSSLNLRESLISNKGIEDTSFKIKTLAELANAYEKKSSNALQNIIVCSNTIDVSVKNVQKPLLLRKTIQNPVSQYNFNKSKQRYSNGIQTKVNQHKPNQTNSTILSNTTSPIKPLLSNINTGTSKPRCSSSILSLQRTSQRKQFNETKHPILKKRNTFCGNIERAPIIQQNQQDDSQEKNIQISTVRQVRQSRSTVCCNLTPNINKYKSSKPIIMFKSSIFQKRATTSLRSDCFDKKQKSDKQVQKQFKLCINCDLYINKQLTLKHQKECIGFKIILKMSNDQFIDFLNEKIQTKIIELQQLKKQISLEEQIAKRSSLVFKKHKLDKLITDLDMVRLSALKKFKPIKPSFQYDNSETSNSLLNSQNIAQFQSD